MKLSKYFATLAIASFCFAYILNPASVHASFKDVGESYEYKEAINWGQTKKYWSGYEDGNFKPQNSITRQEFLKILLNTKYTAEQINECKKTDLFSDVKSDNKFIKFICFAKENKIVSGYKDGTFKSENYISVKEASKIINNTFKLDTSTVTTSPWEKQYLEALEKENAIPTSIGSIDDELKRSEMAEITYRLHEHIKHKSSHTYDKLSEKTLEKDFDHLLEDDFDYLFEDDEFDF